MLREHRIHRWPYVGLLALVAIMVAGCGGNREEEDIKEVVEPAILADARETISPPSPPAYLDARMGELRVEDLQVRRQGERAATVRAVVRVPVELKPKPDKEEFLRVVPASGGAVTLSRPVEAAVTKVGSDWQVTDPEDGIEFDDAPVTSEAAPAETEQARQLAIEAVSALLTYDGDLDAYNRAQGDFYATKLATEADFNQPGFDPPPLLARESDVAVGEGDSAGAVWRRTNDGGEDDLFVSDALRFTGEEPEGFTCPAGFALSVIEATTVSGQPQPAGETSAGTFTAGIGQDLVIEGQAVVRAGDWICEEITLDEDEETRRVGPRDTRVEYRAVVSRLSFGQGGWFVSSLTLGDDLAGGGVSTGADYNLYSTSGQALDGP